MQPTLYERIPCPGLFADAIVIVHALIVVFVLLGLVLIVIGGARRWAWVRGFWFRLAHLVTIGFVVLQTWLGQLCPLTVWEAQLRRATGQAFHEQSFIQFWVGRLLFFDLPWWVFVAAYTGFGLLVVLTWWWVPPRRPGTGSRQQ